jgi:hypothetical protein
LDARDKREHDEEKIGVSENEKHSMPTQDYDKKLLLGGASAINCSVAVDKRPRQNSHDLLLSQPGCAWRMILTSRVGPTTVSRRRMSAKDAKSIACAIMRSSVRGCEPTGSHQKYFFSNSATKSGVPVIWFPDP